MKTHVKIRKQNTLCGVFDQFRKYFGWIIFPLPYLSQIMKIKEGTLV